MSRNGDVTPEADNHDSKAKYRDRIIKYVDHFDFSNYCTTLTKSYEKIGKIGHGTYGEVFKGRHRITGQFVAMKKIHKGPIDEGFPVTAVRELTLLQSLKHENIVKFIEVCSSKGTFAGQVHPDFYYVFEFCEHDLAGLLFNQKVHFSVGEIKNIMQQILSGLYFMHSNQIMHRDLKPANILITKEGSLKLADLGLARKMISNLTDNDRYSPNVVSLWYRAPEILLGDRRYGCAVDMWSVGCIMAQMWSRKPIMGGENEQQQLTMISKLCGSISTKVWPEVEYLDLYSKVELIRGEERKVTTSLSFVKDSYAIDLLDKLLTLDPSQRVDADSAMAHEFFWNEPMSCPLLNRLSEHSKSMFLYTIRDNNQMIYQHHPAIEQDQYQDRIF